MNIKDLNDLSFDRVMEYLKDNPITLSVPEFISNRFKYDEKIKLTTYKNGNYKNFEIGIGLRRTEDYEGEDVTFTGQSLEEIEEKINKKIKQWVKKILGNAKNSPLDSKFIKLFEFDKKSEYTETTPDYDLSKEIKFFQTKNLSSKAKFKNDFLIKYIVLNGSYNSVAGYESINLFIKVLNKRLRSDSITSPDLIRSSKFIKNLIYRTGIYVPDIFDKKLIDYFSYRELVLKEIEDIVANDFNISESIDLNNLLIPYELLNKYYEHLLSEFKIELDKINYPKIKGDLL